MDRKGPGCGSVLKCAVRNVIFIDRSTFCCCCTYYSFVCIRNSSFILTVEWENVRVLLLKRFISSRCHSPIGPETFRFVKKSVYNVHSASCSTFKLSIFITWGLKFRYHKFCLGLCTTSSLLLSLFGTAPTCTTSPV